MTIVAPINRKVIEDAIYDWFFGATGIATRWANQSTGPEQPAHPFATLFNLTPAIKLGQDEIRIRDASADDPAPVEGSEVEMAAVGLRKMVVSCNVYSKSNDPNADARALMDKAHAALGMLSFQEALRTAGLSIIDDGSVRSLDGLESDKIIARTQLDVTFGLASNAVESVGYIETIELEREISDGTADVIDDTVTLTLPDLSK